MRIDVSKASCEKCIFFDPISRDEGMCQVRPPQVFVIDGKPATHFPIVNKARLCGSYRPDVDEELLLRDKMASAMAEHNAKVIANGKVAEPPQGHQKLDLPTGGGPNQKLTGDGWDISDILGK